MLTNTGFFLLIIALLSNAINILSYIFKKKINEKIFYYSIYISFVSIFISFFILVYCYTVSDFSNFNVFQNSHSSKPLFYKIVGAWGNHEGSMLMWILIMSTYLFIFSLNNSLSKTAKKLTIVFQSLLVFGFNSFLITTSNPFIINKLLVNEGLGLNPILQDPLLAIHPPMLYFGYVGFSILLSLALSALITGELNDSWIKIAKKWSVYCWSTLTAGIALGAYWAYYELGWGGWWFWDPVENVSLMPWIAGLALVHSLLITKEEHLLKRWIVFLCILCFSLSLIGTFLVRSGILTSVHAFASDSSRGLFILILFLIIIGFSLIIYIIKSEDDNQKLNLLFLNKTSALIINNLIMIIACATVLLGTIYPIIIEVITNKRISVGLPYYNSTVLPILLPGLLLMSIAPALSWKTNKLENSKFIIYFFIILSLVLLFITLVLKIDPWGVIGISTSFVIMLGSFYSLLKKNKNTKNKKFLNFIFINNGLIAHLGVGILIMGITISSVYKTEYQKNIKINEIIKLGKYELKLDHINLNNKNNFQSLTANFSLYKNNKFLSKIVPEKRYYSSPKMITTEAGIYHNLLQDFYIVLGDKNNESWSIKFYQNPLINLIWFGALIMFLSGIITLAKK